MQFNLTPPGRADLERAFARMQVPRLSSSAVPEPGSLWRVAWDDNALIAGVLRVTSDEVLLVPVSLRSTPSPVAVTDALFAHIDAPSATPVPAITLDSKISTRATLEAGATLAPDDQIHHQFAEWSSVEGSPRKPLTPSQLTKILGVPVPVALDLVRGNRLPTPEQAQVLAAKLPDFFLHPGLKLHDELRSTMLMRKYRQPVLSVAHQRGVTATTAWRQSCAAIAVVPLRSRAAQTDWEARADYYFSDVL